MNTEKEIQEQIERGAPTDEDFEKDGAVVIDEQFETTRMTPEQMMEPLTDEERKLLEEDEVG